MMQICEGVSFMHSYNIIRLDMKVYLINFEDSYILKNFYSYILAGKYLMC